MKMPPSPCDTCYSRNVCDDYADTCGPCGDWREWFAAVWPTLTARAAQGVPALHLYRAGHNDRQIAETIGVSQPAVCQWRKRNGLPPTGKRGRPESEAQNEHCI